MKNEDLESNEVRLSQILRGARPTPDLPPGFQVSVWRRIEREDLKREPVKGRLWLDKLVGLLLSPRMALAGAASMLLLGSILGVMNGSADAREAARARYVASVAPHVIH